MDKDILIRICNGIIKDNVSVFDVETLLREFCLEKGRQLEETNHFITFLFNTSFLSKCLAVALEYYKKKFNVIEVKRNNEVLLIY